MWIITTLNNGPEVPVCVSSFNCSVCTDGNGIAESCSNFVSGFLRNQQVLFRSGWTILYSHQQCMRVSIFLHIPASICDFLFLKNSSHIRCGFDLQFPDDKWCWVFVHMLVTICRSSLEKGLKSFAHFLTGLFIFLLSCRSFFFFLTYFVY